VGSEAFGAFSHDVEDVQATDIAYTEDGARLCGRLGAAAANQRRFGILACEVDCSDRGGGGRTQSGDRNRVE